MIFLFRALVGRSRRSLLMANLKQTSILDSLKRKSTDEGNCDVRPKRAKTANWRDTIREDFGLQWISAGPEVKVGCPSLYVMHSASRTFSEKFAVFDMDWTLIRPKSGGKWPKGPDDWVWLYPEVPKKLKSLVEDGFNLLFVSNQSGIEKTTTKAEDIMEKMSKMVIALDAPAEALMSTGENHFRKPATGGWDYYCDKILKSKVDLDCSLYVGDAAGRPKDYKPGRKKDFSCSDRMFARNIGIANFHTPEEFFLGEKVAPFSWGPLDPEAVLTAGEKEREKFEKEKFHSEEQEFVVLVGMPASGKSSFCQSFLVPHGYVRVNRDELGTQSKCLKKAQEALEAKKSVVVDNTNPSKADRKAFIDIAKKAGIPCRCFLMGTSKELALHLNYFRQAQTLSKVRRIPMVAYHTYKSRYEAPHLHEGFAEIKTIPWTPKFSCEKDRKTFLLWTTPV